MFTQKQVCATGGMSRVDSLLYSMAEELVRAVSVTWDVGANVGLFSFCAPALSVRQASCCQLSRIYGFPFYDSILSGAAPRKVFGS